MPEAANGRPIMPLAMGAGPLTGAFRSKIGSLAIRNLLRSNPNSIALDPIPTSYTPVQVASELFLAWFASLEQRGTSRGG